MRGTISYRSFDLGLLSKYRTHLMGISAVFVLICHSNVYDVAFPAFVRKIFRFGNVGVDIFFLLSGIGCYYSISRLAHHTMLGYGKWIGYRYLRIFVPYLLCHIIQWLLFAVIGILDIWDELYVFSTVAFWTQHRGHWFIAALIPLYAITPCLFNVFETSNRRYLIMIFLIILFLVISILPNNCDYTILHEVFRNIQIVIWRTSSFILGLFLAPLVKNRIKVNLLYIISGPLLFSALFHLLFPSINYYIFLVLPICVIVCMILESLKDTSIINRSLIFLGVMSLELYLTNQTYRFVFAEISSWYPESVILSGNFVGYFCVLLSGIITSWFVNSVSSKINLLK